MSSYGGPPIPSIVTPSSAGVPGSPPLGGDSSNSEQQIRLQILASLFPPNCQSGVHVLGNVMLMLHTVRQPRMERTLPTSKHGKTYRVHRLAVVAAQRARSQDTSFWPVSWFGWAASLASMCGDADLKRCHRIAVTPDGRCKIHKSKRNTNGTFSIGKTWNLEDLRGLEVHVRLDAADIRYNWTLTQSHCFLRTTLAETTQISRAQLIRSNLLHHHHKCQILPLGDRVCTAAGRFPRYARQKLQAIS